MKVCWEKLKRNEINGEIYFAEQRIQYCYQYHFFLKLLYIIRETPIKISANLFLENESDSKSHLEIQKTYTVQNKCGEEKIWRLLLDLKIKGFKWK